MDRSLAVARRGGASGIASAFFCLSVLTAPAAAAGTAAVADALVPHRAVYDLKLAKSEGSSGLASANGRMVFEVKGSACRGWTVNFRFVTDSTDSEGRSRLTDLRSSTYESGDGRLFRFENRNYVDARVVEESAGEARRERSAIKVTLTKPKHRVFEIDGSALFPTQHLITMIEAAQQGRRLLQKIVYDGSENGDKVYDATAVIGAAHDGGADAKGEAVVLRTSLAQSPQHAVTVSYFERGTQRSGEATPDYAMSFRLYPNGVSRRLRLDYGDFVLEGRLVDLKLDRPQRADACH